MKRSILAALAATVLALGVTACASVQQAVDVYGGIAVTNARAANDTLIQGYKVGLCALPLSAIARHPEIVPAVRSLCLNPADPVSAELLDAIERQAAAKVQP